MARQEKAVHSAEYWEKRARRKKLARQRQLRRRIAAAAVVFVVLAVIIGVAVRMRKPAEAPPAEPVREPVVITPEATGSTVSVAESDAAAEAAAAAAAAVEKNNTENEMPAEAAEAAEAAEPAEAEPAPAEPTPEPEPIDISNDARASFAVDPSFTDWNYDGDGTKTVYLTFDDGPSPNTPEVLNILDNYGIKATFFVTAQLPQYASYIREAYLRGHTIGLHSFSHDYSVYASEEVFLTDLAQIGDVVKTQIGYVPCFIRFPGGSSNETSKEYSEGIMSILTARVQELGYQYYDWNVAVGDGAETVTVEEELARAMDTDADTVLLLAHDGESKHVTVEALPQIIEGYIARGYSFRALDRTSKVIHHPVMN